MEPLATTFWRCGTGFGALHRPRRAICGHHRREDAKMPNRRTAEEGGMRAPHGEPCTTSAVPDMARNGGPPFEQSGSGGKCANLGVTPPSWRLPCRLEAGATAQIRTLPNWSYACPMDYKGYNGCAESSPRPFRPLMTALGWSVSRERVNLLRSLP